LTEQELRALIERIIDEHEAAERKRRLAFWMAVYRQLLGIAGVIKKERLEE